MKTPGSVETPAILTTVCQLKLVTEVALALSQVRQQSQGEGYKSGGKQGLIADSPSSWRKRRRRVMLRELGVGHRQEGTSPGYALLRRSYSEEQPLLSTLTLPFFVKFS